MPKPQDIKYLVIHTSDSPWGSVGAIRQWHTLPPPDGRGWRDIAYQYVITNGFTNYPDYKNNKRNASTDGIVYPGRDLDKDGDVEEEIGGHAVGYNHNSLGICLVGSKGVYTPKQIYAVNDLCLKLMAKYNIPVDNVIGHYETADAKRSGKTCPDIDMPKFRENLIRLRLASQQVGRHKI